MIKIEISKIQKLYFISQCYFANWIGFYWLNECWCPCITKKHVSKQWNENSKISMDHDTFLKYNHVKFNCNLTSTFLGNARLIRWFWLNGKYLYENVEFDWRHKPNIMAFEIPPISSFPPLSVKNKSSATKFILNF